MKKLDHIPPERLIVTDPPSTNTVARKRSELPSNFGTRWGVHPIILVRDRRGLLIADGNCRAYLLAQSCVSISGLLIERDSDSDAIITLEAKQQIEPFPHREFLMGHQRLAQLRQAALEEARKYRFITIRDLLSMDIDAIAPTDNHPSQQQSTAGTCRSPCSGSAREPNCLVLRGNSREYYLPIKKGHVSAAQAAGYRCIIVDDPEAIGISILWARACCLDSDVERFVEI